MSIRTCLVTGKKGNSKEFYRFTVQKGKLAFDSSQRQKNSGRGGYIEKSEKALERLLSLEKKIKHFLKINKVVIEKEVIEEQKFKLSSF